jgi:hypothetical protein
MLSKHYVKIGTRNILITFRQGQESFIELYDRDTKMSLHIREEEDNFLVAFHFTEGQEDPVNQIDLDTGEHCWYEHAR